MARLNRNSQLTGTALAPSSVKWQKQLLHRHLLRHQSLIERIADKPFQIRAILFQTVRPGIGAQQIFLFLKRLSSPREPRPIGIGVELAADSFGCAERFELTRGGGIFSRHVVVESDHRYDWSQTGFSLVALTAASELYFRP